MPPAARSHSSLGRRWSISSGAPKALRCAGAAPRARDEQGNSSFGRRGTAGGARKPGRWLTRWWFRAPDGRVYQRRRADALVAAAGLGVVIVCGVLVANQLVVGPDVALFHRINHWPGWLYPPMWVVQLSGVIGALPLLAAAAALLRRFRWPLPWRRRRC
jgi:hypothetical protein